MNTRYAVIWFEGDNVYILTDSHDKTILLSRDEVQMDGIPLLGTETQVEDADEDIRYAIPTNLLADMFGWEPDQ